MNHTDENLMAAAIVVGMSAALAVLFAFFKPFKRFACGSRVFPDALGAGIWIRAIGTMAAGGSVLGRMLGWHGVLGLYLFGWAMVTAGYFLHFSAWRGAYFNRKGLFATEFLVVLVLTWIGAYWFFGWVNP